MDGAMLEAEDLACRRGEAVVFAGLSFRLAPGGALLLRGANGAGKSSLLRVLAGLLAPAAGRVLWAGADALADRTGHGARVRYLGHADAVKPGLTVAANLAPWVRLWGGDAAAALARAGLGPLAGLPARVLSAGQRRRLALARLTLGAAPLWLLDEPTLGLDAAAVARLGEALAVHRAGGGLVVAATHLPLPLPGAADLGL